MERGSLWCKVLRAKYCNANHSKPSSWWLDLSQVCSPEGHEMWFEDNIKRKLREGNDTLFWKDDWLNQGKLIDKYPRLFHLSTQGNYHVKKMGYWTNGTWNWDFKWRRSLRDPEIQLLETFLLAVHTATLHEGSLDSWTWTAAAEGMYTVSSAYDVLQGEIVEERGRIFRIYGRYLHPLTPWLLVGGFFTTETKLERT